MDHTMRVSNGTAVIAQADAILVFDAAASVAQFETINRHVAQSDASLSIYNVQREILAGKLPGRAAKQVKLGIWILGRCFRCLRSLCFRNLRFGRRRLGWLLFGGLWLLLLLLFLRWLLNLFHFIFVSHGKYSSSQKNGVHNIIQAWLTVCSPFDSAM